MGQKHELNPARVLTGAEDAAELRAMRACDHDNVNRFHGLSLDAPEALLSVWRYCQRGSLRDVISNNTLARDGVFIYSIVSDLCEGLAYIHSDASKLGWHGSLRSAACLVDERWQVKISYYGLTPIKRAERLLQPPTARQQLWSAPEVLQSPTGTDIHGRGGKGGRSGSAAGTRFANKIGSKSSDIYSFAIVCSEVVNLKTAWEGDLSAGRYRDPEEIVYLVKRMRLPPARPALDAAVDDLNPALLHLIRDCWTDDPEGRPGIETVRQLLRTILRNSNASTNLMDHVFMMMEQYANSLEEEVAERTRELMEEKKKSDLLLYRMLPQQVADRLKVGQGVEPEAYDSVTVFFSDVVQFTNLAARLKPLQVVNLLNELYTVFDNTISEYDVYKVETIGDGYLCVSGLPKRNGVDHVKHIAELSLQLIRALEHFSIPSLPGEKIRLRIGLHSGNCVAGVVGLTMPRYCLFGDSVNTASRMESSSMANRIQCSQDTHRLLQMVGGYVTESRGEVLIKGKGVMETFWLLGRRLPDGALDIQDSQATAIINFMVEPAATELITD